MTTVVWLGGIDGSLEAVQDRVREEAEGYETDLKRFLLMFSDRIFDSRVDRGIPSLTAAPAGPDTRPPVSFSAVSMMSFSCIRNLRRSSTGCFDSFVRVGGNQPSSMEKVSVSQSIIERSMTFCSSRMFPGQG